MGSWTAFLAAAALLLVHCTGDEEDQQLLNNINDYRSKLGIPPLVHNDGAACLADKLADRFGDQPCNNVTQSQTSIGRTPSFPEYPKYLQECRLQLMNTTGGQVLVDCIPSALASNAAATAAQNLTMSQEYQKYMNSTDYTSVGIASDDLWFVVVLAKNSTDANYIQNKSSATRSSAGGSLFVAAVATVLAAIFA